MERRQVREESHHSKCYEHRVSFTCSSSPPCTHTHTLCMLSSQPVFQISAHTLNKTRILPSVNTQADTSMCNTHTHTHTITHLFIWKPSNAAEPAFYGLHNTASEMLLSPYHLIVSPPSSYPPFTFLFITFTLQSSISSYIPPTPFPLSAVFPFFPHFCHYFPAAWKLNCDPSCCSILGALTWECISIHCGVYIWLSVFHVCDWLPVIREVHPGHWLSVFTFCVIPEVQDSMLLVLPRKQMYGMN